MFGFTIPGIALKLLPYAAGAIIVAIIFKFGVNFGRGIERVHTEEAKKEFASYKQEEQEARLRSTVVQLSIRDEVRSLYDQSIKDSTALAGAVRDLSRGYQRVRIDKCNASIPAPHRNWYNVSQSRVSTSYRRTTRPCSQVCRKGRPYCH